MVRTYATSDGRWPPLRSDEDEWRTLVLLGDVPVARLRMPHPGAASEGFRRAALDRHADAHRSYLELRERMERRLGVPRLTPRRLSCSVVVCTHRRPLMLAGLLQALGRLDPAPDEIIVVDNDPGDLDVRDAAQAADARYLREDRRGLDNARATGLAAARSELVAFVDDDCLPSRGWLSALDELFDDRRVAAVTGPAFAHELDTPAKLAFEESGGFSRGFHRRVHEWVNLAPAGATRAGAGANMILRRSAAIEAGELFPPELDAGTPTESGGDLYALYRLLAAGWRVVYDPGTYVLHRHRADLPAMHRTFRGYGTGLAAALSKLLVEERELPALAAAWWLVEQYVQSLSANRLQRQIAMDYLRGAAKGPRALRAASRKTIPARAKPLSTVDRQPSTPPPTFALPQAPAVSVIVTTHYRPESLRQCVAALARQEEGTPPFELIVANDARAPVESIDGARVIETGGVGTGRARNAAAAAARGRLLLFLDDDLVPAADLVRRHAEAHEGAGERVAVGYCEPRPRRRNLASMGAATWWEDHYRALRDAASLTFMDVLSGNMSVPRETFERIGGFDPGLARREDWEWGLRVLEAGVQVDYVPGARAAHEFVFGTRRALAASRQHGRCDATLIARRPATGAALPVRWSYRQMPRRPLRAAVFLTAQRQWGQAAGCLALDLLERAKARPTWARLFGVMHAAAYERGRREGGDPRRPLEPAPVVEIELDSDEPVTAPVATAPRVRLLAGGEPVAEFSTDGGHWGRDLAERIAAAGYWDWWRVVQSRRPGLPTRRALLIDEPCWLERDRAIRAAAEDTVVVPLDGAAEDGRWLVHAAEAVAADRVAIAIGAAVADAEPAYPLSLHSRATDPGPFPAIGRPPRYIAFRRDAYLMLGGIDPAVAELGDAAVALELCERALEAGWLVAGRDVPAGSAARSERAASIERTRARAALLAVRARRLGERPPVAPALRRLAAGVLPGGPSLAGGVAHAAAWLAGLVAAGSYRTTAPAPRAVPRSSGAASQRWWGRSTPSPAERPVTRSG